MAVGKDGVQPVALMLGDGQAAGVLDLQVAARILRQPPHGLGVDRLQHADQVGNQQLERRHAGNQISAAGADVLFHRSRPGIALLIAYRLAAASLRLWWRRQKQRSESAPFQPMRERLTARVLLFDPAGRILLMKGRLRSGCDACGVVHHRRRRASPVRPSGRRRPGKSARRPASAAVELGPVVWRRQGPLILASGERVLFNEHYIVGRCAGGEVSRAGWDETEQALIDDIRWWAPG